MHCENYPCKIVSGCVCKCENCKDTLDIKQELEALKIELEALKAQYPKTDYYCPHCGKPYVDLTPAPYVPWTWPTVPPYPNGPIWITSPNTTISDGTILNPLEGITLNSVMPNWVNSDGSSLI